MAKKDLRAQMEAARAAAAFIGAAQEAENAGPEPSERPDAEAATASEKTAALRPAVAPAEGSGDSGKAAADDAAGEASLREATDVPASVIAKTAASGNRAGKRASRQVKSAASDVTLPATVPDFFSDAVMGEGGVLDVAAAEAQGADRDVAADPVFMGDEAIAESVEIAAPEPAPAPAKPKRARKPRKKAAEVEEVAEAGSNRMTAQVLVPMTAEQREHADLLAQVKKITRAEVMRQALDEYWDNHKSELQQAVAAYEQLIRKLMK